MRLLRTIGLCALLLSGAGACENLTLPNNNQPDQTRVIANAHELESLVAGSYLTLFYGYTWQTDLVLSTTAFQHSSMACCFGMVQYSRLPREPINNSASDPYASMHGEIWYNSYAAIKAAVDGLNATDPANPDAFQITDETTGADNTPRARAWARFVQGLGHGLLALTYDQAFVYDQGTDPTEIVLAPYGDVMKEALAMLDSAAAIAAANDFTIPDAWFGNVGMTRAQFIKTVNGYQALLRAGVARTPTERAAVNWPAVIADVDASFQCAGTSCENLTIDADPSVWIHGTHFYIGFAITQGAWAQVSYFIHGMADQSGAFKAWFAKPDFFRTPFLIQTPDKRFPQGATATAQASNPGKYILYGGTRGHLRPDRGSWRWSLYRDYRLDGTPGNHGPSIMMSGRDLRLLKAEGLFRAGQLQAAADIINETRVAHGALNATNAAGLNSSCVPKLPNGSCGNLFEMLKWEKRMENYQYNFGAWFFDSRGWGDLFKGTPIHFPVPARELQVLGLPIYTFGGPGGYAKGASPGSSYAYPGE
ncbi:MAG TPA: hypothetical protein VFT45_02520 [Longimicrobium sp.]|nr:hypothetical protein [Longimicrobium sp.]